MIAEGFARRFLALKGGKNQTEVRFTLQESLAQAQVEPVGYEMSRAGRRFYLAYNGTAPTGIAPVQAFPTTAAQWAITNADVYKSYVFETLGVMAISGTLPIGGFLLGCIFQLPYEGGLAEATGVAVANASFSSLGSKAVIKSAVTIAQPAVPLWFPVAESPLSAANVVPGTQIINRALAGRIIVPPQCGLGLVVMSAAGTSPLFLPVAEWLEIESDLE